jgi:hypothetical protein
MSHGHGDIGWWTENVINHDLIKRFNVTKMVDDGIGEFDVSNHRLYDSYEAHQRHRWVEARRKKGWLKDKLRERMVKDNVKSGAEISDVYGEDFTVGPSPWQD